MKTGETQCNISEKPRLGVSSSSRKYESIWDQMAFCNKIFSDGTVTKHKARFVAKVNSQQQVIGYKYTYSPTTILSNVRIILQIVADLGKIRL